MCCLAIGKHMRKIYRKFFDGFKANQGLDFLYMLLHYFLLLVDVSRLEFA